MDNIHRATNTWLILRRSRTMPPTSPSPTQSKTKVSALLKCKHLAH